LQSRPGDESRALPERHSSALSCPVERGILIPPGSAVTVLHGLSQKEPEHDRPRPVARQRVVAALAALPAERPAPPVAGKELLSVRARNMRASCRRAITATALTMIASRFNQKGKHVLGHRSQDRQFRTDPRDGVPPLGGQHHPSRFCSGVVEVTDGRKHAIHYSISEDTGMIGASWGIEWCVVGLDRNWSYNPACKMAQP
jgi:hypothetical protein